MNKKITIIWGSDRDPNNKETYEFETGQQVYDFILNYKTNIEKGKLSNKSRRMLLWYFLTSCTEL